MGVERHSIRGFNEHFRYGCTFKGVVMPPAIGCYITYLGGCFTKKELL